MSEYQGIVYAAPPPSPDIIPNFNNPTNSGSLVISICVLLPLTVIITGFRIWTRAQNRQFGLDDWLMIAATALSVVMAALIIDMLPRGMGHHIWDVPVTILFPGFMLVSLLNRSMMKAKNPAQYHPSSNLLLSKCHCKALNIGNVSPNLHSRYHVSNGHFCHRCHHSRIRNCNSTCECLQLLTDCR